MTHHNLLEKFLKAYPIDNGNIDCWYKIDESTIRVRLKNRKEMIFTYISSNKWCIESMDAYNQRMRAERKIKMQNNEKRD